MSDDPTPSHPAVDTDRWPAVVVVLDESVEPDTVEEVVAAMDAVLARREPVGFVFDYGRGDPRVQQRISMWMAERVDLMRAFVRAGVTVVDPARVEHIQSMIAQGGFPAPFDAWATGTVDEGVDWVLARF